MQEFLWFLKHRPLWWILPIVIFFGAIVLVAWLANQVPVSPFDYRI